jgi:hypothetical protein
MLSCSFLLIQHLSKVTWAEFVEWQSQPTSVVGYGVAEHVNEYRLDKFVESGKHLKAFGSEGVCCVKNRSDPPLLLDRR